MKSDEFWQAVADGPDGAPMAMKDFRAWAAVAAKRIAQANAERDAAKNELQRLMMAPK